MDVVGIGRIEGSGSGATVPAHYSPERVLFMRERGRGPAAKAVRGAGNAGHGASPTAGKRECFSF
jgi:hypothetical protein